MQVMMDLNHGVRRIVQLGRQSTCLEGTSQNPGRMPGGALHLLSGQDNGIRLGTGRFGTITSMEICGVIEGVKGICDWSGIGGRGIWAAIAAL